MTIAAHLSHYLAAHDVTYDIIEHQPTSSAMEVVGQTRIPREQVLKAVLLRDKQGYVLALLPASERINLGHMRDLLHRRVRLATETEIANRFADCEMGAIPAIGAAYDLDMVIDDSLTEQPDVYFEGGDHRSLVHMSGADFWRLAGTARYERFVSPS